MARLTGLNGTATLQETRLSFGRASQSSGGATVPDAVRRIDRNTEAVIGSPPAVLRAAA